MRSATAVKRKGRCTCDFQCVANCDSQFTSCGKNSSTKSIHAIGSRFDNSRASATMFIGLRARVNSPLPAEAVFSRGM
ncbi:hypothetical protein D3C83_198590 [compost metagenome]